MNRVDYIKETGEWWYDPWWESPAYLRQVNATLEEVSAAVLTLRLYFTSELVKAFLQRPTKNMLIATLGLTQ